MYDVAIIGAGPAGLFAAYELITKNNKLKVVLLDRGKLAENRVCPMNVGKDKCLNCDPCAILSGYGGAGTFSDGKLNISGSSFNVLGNYSKDVTVERKIIFENIKTFEAQ